MRLEAERNWKLLTSEFLVPVHGIRSLPICKKIWKLRVRSVFLLDIQRD
jgi:hypothetical protein